LSAEFFADRNCGGRIFPEALRQAGIVVHRHDDHFGEDAEDGVWLPEVASRAWVALTFDKRIRHNDVERAAVFESGARLILLTGANATALELARNFVNTLPQILAFLDRHPAPFIARVRRPSPVADIEAGRPGAIEMRVSAEEWRKRGPRR
jgi:hypothetical protein